MIVFGSQKEHNGDIAYVDTNIIAFHVSEEESENVGEYLVTAIITRCMMEFGETPEVW